MSDSPVTLSGSVLRRMKQFDTEWRWGELLKEIKKYVGQEVAMVTMYSDPASKTTYIFVETNHYGVIKRAVSSPVAYDISIGHMTHQQTIDFMNSWGQLKARIEAVARGGYD